MTRITRSLRAVVTLAACVLTAPALGQIDSLPATDKTSYSQPERDEITAFVKPRVELIGQGETADRERARRELLTPLSRPGVSVAFRRAVREAAIDPLTALAASKDDAVAINALLVLGEIADDPSRQVLERYTDDSRVAVRYAAVASMTQTFRAIDRASPAIDPSRVSEMVRHLTGRLTTETDASVADAIARSLLVASNIRREEYAAASGRATTGLASGVGERLRKADEGDRQVALMTAVRVAEAFAGRLAAAGRVSPEVAKAGAGFSGEVLAHLAYLANQGTMPSPTGWESDLVTLSERNLVFAAMKLGGTLATPGLPALVERGDARAFYERVSKLVLGLNGRPFMLPDADMQAIRDALEGK